MRTLDSLKENDFIAFAWSYNSGDERKTIEVANITYRQKGYSIVHFLYGYKSVSETIKDEDVIAIGNLETGKTKIHGWGGTFDVLQPEHKLLKEEH